MNDEEIQVEEYAFVDWIIRDSIEETLWYLYDCGYLNCDIVCQNCKISKQCNGEGVCLKENRFMREFLYLTGYFEKEEES